MRAPAHDPAQPQTGGDAHLQEIERDLAQMDALLDAAIRKLLESFMAIHRDVASQQQTLQTFAAEHAGLEACAARLDALRGDIERNVGEAIAGLQFQDMTSQLIRRMREHLASVRGMLDGATDAQAVHARQPRAVKQHHLDCGDIELF